MHSTANFMVAAEQAADRRAAAARARALPSLSRRFKGARRARQAARLAQPHRLRAA